MAKQTINIGSSPNKGDGDPLRTAFDKVNDNFDELYARDINTDSQSLSLTGDTLSISGSNSVDLSKYVDSTFSGSYTDLTDTPTIPADISDLTDTGSLLGGGPGDIILNSGRINNSVSDGSGIQIEADTDFEIKVVGSEDTAIWSFEPNDNGRIQFPDGSTQTTAYPGPQSTFDGDLTGSVFADDSTLLVDGVDGKIVGDVENSLVVTSTIIGNSSLVMAGANTDTDGGDLGLTGGIGSNGEGGRAFLLAGNGSTDGGDLTLGGGIAGTGAGGEVLIYGGTGNTDGGRVRILGGNGLVNGGDLLLWAGSGVTSGGTLDLRGGAGAGNVTIDGGPGEEGSTQGSVLIGTTEFTESVVIDKAIITGDVTGSVFADNSTLLVDGVDGKIVGPVETTRLRTSETTIALGSGAGLITQGVRAVAIGDEAGRTDQGVRAVAIGYYAGQNNQRTAAVAIGDEAGRTDQGIRAVAIGYLAGGANQGNGAVAIGDEAGRTNQAANSIVINATGSILDNTVADTFVVKPVRNVSSFNGGGNFLHYNTTSGEISHSVIDWSSVVGTAIQATGLPVLPTQTLDISGSVFADDSTLLVDGVAGKIVGPVDTASVTFPDDTVQTTAYIDKFVNRSTFTADTTVTSMSANLLNFDAFQGQQAFDGEFETFPGQWTADSTGLYRLDFVLGLTQSEIDLPLIVFLYNVTGSSNQITLHSGNYTGTVTSMSGTTYLTAGERYQFGIIQTSGDDIILDKDLTSVGIEQLT